jgi:nicotinate dehydrogenase subunit B
MANEITKQAISRRDLLKGVGALVVSFSFLPRVIAHAQETNPTFAATLGTDATSLDSWLAVAADGTITVSTSKVDLGTGVVTALSQIVSEELDVAFHQIHMETGDTAETIDQAATVGSSTIQRGGPQLRQAAAAARVELLKLASASLQTPVEKLTVTDGVVSVVDNPAKKISYATLVGGKRFDVKITATGSGGGLKVAPEVTPKDPKTYRVVGTSAPRVDLPPKFTGQFTYTADVRVPGMLHGRVIRPMTVSTKPASVDEASIKDIAGVVKVVQQGSFLGVVAETEWAAIHAAKKLKVTWSAPESKYPLTKEETFDYLLKTKSARDQSAVNRGNLDAAISQGTKTFDATYRWPFQMHGMLGPSCAVADVQENAATVWAGSQGTFNTRKALSDLLEMPENTIRVIYRESAGCYGRLVPDDVPLDAALMSRAVGKPVRVQWMRDDEHGWEPKGPAQLLTVRAAVDAGGKITAWDFIDRSFPWTEVGNPLLAARQIGRKPTGTGIGNGVAGGGQIYNIENQKVIAAMIPWVFPEPMPLRTCNLRAPGDVARTFASETAIDEIASAVGVDPVEIRLRYLTDSRIVDVLNAAAKQAQWKPRASATSAAAPTSSSGAKATGRGVAVANRGETMTATIAEVEVDKTTGKIAVKRVTLAQDCGLIVNPDGARNQIEGNVMQGVSRALLEEVKFDATGIRSLNWATYPILHFPDVPEVDIVLINRPDMPSLGGGEPALVGVPAAIANAVFDAVRVRLREVPMTPERVLAALKAGAATSQLQPRELPTLTSVSR